MLVVNLFEIIDKVAADDGALIDMGSVVLAGDKEHLALRDVMGDGAGVEGVDKVEFTGSDKRWALDGLQLLEGHLGLVEHHANERMNGVLVFLLGELSPERGLDAFGEDIGAGSDDGTKGAWVEDFELQGDIATIAPTEDGRTMEIVSLDKSIDILGHVDIVVLGQRGVGALSAGVEGIDEIAGRIELIDKNGEVVVFATIAMQKNHRTVFTVSLDLIDNIHAIDINILDFIVVFRR